MLSHSVVQKLTRSTRKRYPRGGVCKVDGLHRQLEGRAEALQEVGHIGDAVAMRALKESDLKQRADLEGKAISCVSQVTLETKGRKLMRCTTSKRKTGIVGGSSTRLERTRFLRLTPPLGPSAGKLLKQGG